MVNKKLLIVSHKESWKSTDSASGYATSGGFHKHVKGFTQIFDAVTVLVPVVEATEEKRKVENPYPDTVRVVPLRPFSGGSTTARQVAILRNTPSYFRKLVKELKSADIVHLPLPSSIGYLGLAALKLIKKPVVIRHCATWHNPNSSVQKVLKGYLEKQAGKNFIVFATGGESEPPSDNLSIEWIFSTSLEVENPQLRYKELPEPVRLIHVGRQVKQKGADIAIAAVNKLKAEGIDSTLTVVGDGSYLNDLKEHAEKSGVARYITFTGAVPQAAVPKLLDEHDIFLFPTSLNEGFPKAVLEAMSRGLPVISSAVSVLPTLVKGSGYTIEQPSPDSLADAISYLVSNKEQYALFSANAQKVANRYTLSAWSEKIRNKIEEDVSW